MMEYRKDEKRGAGASIKKMTFKEEIEGTKGNHMVKSNKLRK